MEALLYAGLANNGFSFWIGPNNKVVKVDDFAEFLQRCLKSVPEANRAAVRKQLESTAGDDGIANFIDESIGLLPYSNDPSRPAVAVKEGSTWDLDAKRVDNPIPMEIKARCVVKELNTTSAEILLSGRINSSPTPTVLRSPDGDIRVLVQGGYSSGTCKIDRQTGLPTQSQIRRHLELSMEMPDGQVIKQNKESVSEITAFLEQPKRLAPDADSRVQQTNLQNAHGTENHRRVLQAVGTRPDR
jgi:hypothetical protein